MMTSLPLPLECLQLIIRQLIVDDDASTLFRLLLVNKYIYAATLPILYEDPFQVLSAGSYNIPVRLSKLIKLLLGSSPDAQISDVLRVAFLQNPIESKDHQPVSVTERTSIPYYSFLTRAGLQPYSSLVGRVFQGANEDFTHYLKVSGLSSQYEEEGIFDRPNRRPSDVMTNVASLKLRQDLTWALCANAECIRSLVIIISDVTRYIPLVGRFEVLTEVTFVLDKNIREVGFLDRRASSSERKVLERLRVERIQHLEEMILFVQDHRRRHPNVLVIGRCIKEKYGVADCPEEYQRRLLQSLPPLINPRSLDLHNWIQFVAKAEDTNLSFLKSFDLPENSIALSLNQLPFLNRCRSLEDLKTISIGKGVFQWAIEERRQYNTDTATGRLPQQPLVPLRNFAVNNGQLSVRHIINDVAFAFSSTLEKIAISGGWKQQNLDLETPDSTIDDEPFWSLPRLSTLSAEAVTNDGCIHIHPEFLSRCPRLVNVFLSDRLHEYSMSSIQRWKPFALPHLTTLNLQGAPAVSFHPDSLKNTPKLVFLRLAVPEQLVDMESGEPSNVDPTISTTSPRPRQPIWTWDWELPMLTSIILDGEFAHRFQFRMLDGKPNLSQFVCSFRSSSSRRNSRAVSLADFIKPGSSETPKSAHRPSPPGVLLDGSDDIEADKEAESHLGTQEPLHEPEYIRLPALEHFALTGPWSLSVQVMEVLFSKVFPNVGYLDLENCEGFSLTEWVTCTSSHLHRLATAIMSSSSYRTELTEAGLTPGTQGAFFLLDWPKGRVLDSYADYFVR